ncbi:MAG: desulfoferrodoxin family protein [Anaerovoracaceae bacterium]
MSKQKFFRCNHCGNMIGFIENKGVPVICCGEPMAELIPNTVDAAQEKHVPVAKLEDGCLHVNVGAVDHPMEEDHYITFIYLETERGGHRISLKPGEKPAACFCICGDDKAVAVFEYCNKHGLWKTEL